MFFWGKFLKSLLRYFQNFHPNLLWIWPEMADLTWFRKLKRRKKKNLKWKIGVSRTHKTWFSFFVALPYSHNLKHIRLINLVMFMLRLEWDVSHKLTPVLKMGTDIDGLSTYPRGDHSSLQCVHMCDQRFYNIPLQGFAILRTRHP